MLKRIWAIALNTFREAIRQKVLYVLAVFTVVLILFSLFLGQLTLGADVKMIKDMGLASIYFLGVLISVFVGVGLIFKEVERRTIFTILCKPISRFEFVLGKFFGLCVTLIAEVVTMTLVIYLVLSFYEEGFQPQLLKAIVLICTELCVVGAASIMFSSYSSPFISTVFSIAFVVIGHLTDDLALVVKERIYQMIDAAQGPIESLIGQALLGGTYLLEIFSLDHFSINAKIVHGVPIAWTWVFYSMLYGLYWSILLLSVTFFLFRRKEFQ